jgi:hypothetical protein
MPSLPSRRAFLSSAVALALAASALFSLDATSAQAAASAVEPAANIPLGALPSACDSAPNGAVCTDAAVAALDSARRVLGLAPYVLPTDFATLSGTKQILILSNLDRIAYGLPPIAGIAPALASANVRGISGDSDPDPTTLLRSLTSYAWTANWAGDWANASVAYYEWMYEDGFAGAQTTNIDCTSATASGCWDHRRNILAFAGSGTLVLGAAVGNDPQGQTGYATTLVWTPGSAWTAYSYTWTQAEADGAGVPHSSSLVRKHLHRRRRRAHRHHTKQ